MENELIFDTKQIEVITGIVMFNDYESLKEQAQHLADYIKTVKVDEENIKQSKKLLAAVNKRVKALEDKRIEVKKAILEPYSLFEAQVKDIVNIVKEADQVVRLQVRELEEQEREEKEAQLRTIFDRRKQHYNFKDLISFDHFLKPKHLNKSERIEQTEKEMIAFLEGVASDFKVIQSLPDSQELIEVYLEVFNLASTINTVNLRKAKREQIEQSEPIKEAVKKAYQITLFEEKDLTLVTMFMKENHVRHEIERIEL